MTPRGSLPAARSFGRLPRDRYYNQYVPASCGMRRPGFEKEKPYRLPPGASFLAKERAQLG